MEQFDITETKNYFNSYRIALFTNGQITQDNEGFLNYFMYNTIVPSIFLKDKTCIVLDLPNIIALNNLYYCQLTLNEID